MSFDDGFDPQMTSAEDFRSKFAALIDEHRMSFAELCNQAGVSQSIAERDIGRGTYGLPETQVTLQRLLAVFGLDLSWLLASAPLTSHERPIDRRRRLRTLVWDFAIRNQIPRAHRRPLAEAIVETLEKRPKHTMLLAARSSIPRTITDVAYIYDRMLRQGLLD